MSRRSSFHPSEGGQAIVLIALAMAGLLLGIGLAIDAGTLFVARRTAQSASDAAAWAGAVVLFRGGTASAAIDAVRADATQNGYTHGASSTTITVVTPPTSGEFAGDGRFVAVSISRIERTFFLRGAASGLTTISVHSVAGAAPTGKGLAILTLGSGTALEANGGAQVVVSGSDIQVNSSDTTSAIKTTGAGSSISVTSPGDGIMVVGTGVSGSGISPTPQTGVAAAFDPFLAMPEPPLTATVGTNLRVSDTRTISPGVYDGGIDVTASAILTLSPGVYIMQGGGLKVAGGATVTGSGVMIFNTTSGFPASTGTCGDIAISGGGALSLSAPTSGTYKGMLLWQDKDCGSSASQAVSVTGASELTALSGTFYVPAAQVSITGNTSANVNINSQIIANDLKVSGSATITLTYVQSLTATPLAPALVE
jgi:hypothetical protein